MLVIPNYLLHGTYYLLDRQQPPSRQIRDQQHYNSEQSHRNVECREEKKLVDKETMTIRFDSNRFTITIPILMTITISM